MKTKRVPLQFFLTMGGIPKSDSVKTLKVKYGKDGYYVKCGEYAYYLGNDISNAKTNYIYNTLAH